MRALGIAAAVISVGVGAVQAQALTPTQIARVDSIFAPFSGTARPGCALGIGRDGETVYLKGYGMSDLQHGLAINPQSIFHVASVSKQFAAIAVALLAQDGKLSLDDDVRKHIPELPSYGPAVTVRHLIYHTSGIRDHWELLGLAGWRYPTDLFTQQDVLDVVVRQKALNFKPGDEYLYSNSGYALLAMIVERVAGQTLRVFSDQRIFEPLGMTMTHVHDDHSMVVPGRTSAYESERGEWKISIPNFDTHGATSLFTTVGDLLKWQQNFITGTVGGRRLLDEAETSALLNNGKPANYGFGISIENYRGAKAFGHGGADAGYRADVVRFPEHRLNVAVTCNFAAATPNAYSRAVADILLGDRLGPKDDGPVAAGAVPVSRLEQVAGVYKAPNSDQAFRFAVKDGKLVLANYGVPLVPIDGNRFSVFGITADFVGPPDATPTSMRLRQGRTVIDSMVRMPPFTPNSAALTEFVGEYWSDEVRVSYRVELKEGQLTLYRFKAPPESMTAVFSDAFAAGSSGVVRFVRAKGRVTGFLITGGRVRNVAFTKGSSRP